MQLYIKYCIYTLLYLPLTLAAAPRVEKFTADEALKLVTAIEQIKSYYIDKKSYAELIDRAIEGVVNQLDDYSEYLNSDALAMINGSNSGQYVGIGAELQPHKDGLEVIASFEHSPAASAHLQPGDIITSVNSELLKGKPFSKSLMLFRGKPMSPIELTVISAQTQTSRQLTLRREQLTHFSASYQLIEKNILYVKIPIFTEKTNQEVEKIIEDLQKKTSIDGLILDLRDNPGGLLDSAVRTSDLFLDSRLMKKNTTIVSTKTRSDHTHFTAYATPGDILRNKPIIILINRGSASSAEILASALKDHNRAVLVGQKTFGKGSVQSLISLTKNSAIKLTTGLYKTPKGKIIEGIGIEPDKAIPLQIYSSSYSNDLFIEESLKLLKESPS